MHRMHNDVNKKITKKKKKDKSVRARNSVIIRGMNLKGN